MKLITTTPASRSLIPTTPDPRSLIPDPFFSPDPRSLIPNPSYQRKSASGFTLVELLVVIGIIAVLASSLLLATTGTTESARAAKCLSNIHSLATAANAAAMEGTWYPLAGSREVIGIDVANHTTVYNEQIGWISWLSNQGDPYGTHTPGKGLPSGHQTVAICPFYGTGVDDDVTYAITNGVIWRYVGGSRDSYVCPSHVKYRKDHLDEYGDKTPYWSYVMNSRFGYDYSKGSSATATEDHGRAFSYGHVEKADRLLMLAELPTVDPSDGVTPHQDGDEWECDCTLQAKATVDGKEYGAEWNGKGESIGFNHKIGKRGRCGHVAFADGHVEKITWGVGGLKPEELTALLCNGVDVAFDKGQWKKVADQD